MNTLAELNAAERLIGDVIADLNHYDFSGPRQIRARSALHQALRLLAIHRAQVAAANPDLRGIAPASGLAVRAPQQ